MGNQEGTSKVAGGENHSRSGSVLIESFYGHSAIWAGISAPAVLARIGLLLGDLDWTHSSCRARARRGMRNTLNVPNRG